LHGRLLDQWNQVPVKFEQLSLSNASDDVLWRFTKNAKFSTKFLYECLERDLSGGDNKLIWKAKLPLKIQIFMWQVFRDAIPTRHNLKKRKWMGNPVCSSYNQVETMEHQLLLCENYLGCDGGFDRDKSLSKKPLAVDCLVLSLST
jgi:hypothetical protein